MLNRDFWKPKRHSVATGVAIGLAVSMLPPIPVQMLLAAVIAVLLRANIPIAAAACWFSNPLTWAPILMFQKNIGEWVLPPSDIDAMHPTLHTIRCLALGAIVMAVVIVPIGYFSVYVLWDAIRWVLHKLKPLAAQKRGKQVVVKLPKRKAGEQAPSGNSGDAAVRATQVEPR